MRNDTEGDLPEMKEPCLRCQQPIEMFLHWCNDHVLVFHPNKWKEWQEAWPNTNPLDRLTVAETLEIYGEDLEAHKERTLSKIEEQNEEYLRGPLTFRVELRSIIGLGFQGGYDHCAIETQGRTDADIEQVIEFISSEPNPVVSLDKDDVYVLRLVSLNNEGVRYVWKSKRLVYDEQWTLSEWQ